MAEIQELKADPTVRAIGTVIEARLDKGKGAVATLLVQQGTLNVQDPIVVGNTFGRVRAMTNDLGRRVKVAGPSTPVSITGLNEAPMAGDHFAVYEDEKSARAAGEERAKRALMKQRQATQRVSLENLFDTLKLVNSNQLTLSSRPMYKVLLKPFLPHFKRLMWKVSK